MKEWKLLSRLDHRKDCHIQHETIEGTRSRRTQWYWGVNEQDTGVGTSKRQKLAECECTSSQANS